MKRPLRRPRQVGMKQFAVWLLQGYKRWISPALPPSCRYVPTCSEYAMEAVERYGVWRGGVMAGARILRCHPFVKGGYDPVVNEPAAPLEAEEWASETHVAR